MRSSKKSIRKGNAGTPLNVSRFMSKKPHCIEFDAPIAWAHDIMRKHSIRHLPVLKGSKIAGMISLGDIHIAETMRDQGVDDAVVEDAMSKPFVVERNSAVSMVAAAMAKNKLDAAIVVHEGAPVGIFTTIDALRAVLSLSR
jgi:acetoin utilization protein AcuB